MPSNKGKEDMPDAGIPNVKAKAEQDNYNSLPGMLSRRMRASRDSGAGSTSSRDIGRGSESRSSGGKEMVLNFLVC